MRSIGSYEDENGLFGLLLLLAMYLERYIYSFVLPRDLYISTVRYGRYLRYLWYVGRYLRRNVYTEKRYKYYTAELY